MNSIRNYLLQLLNRSLVFRLFAALCLAYAVLFVVGQIEAIHDEVACWGTSPFFTCLIYELTDLIEVENVEGFSIVVVAITYLIESRDRQQQKHYEAWQVIDNAAAAKVPTSNARIKALEDLNEGRVSLQRLDMPQADLRWIRLPGADLRDTTLTEVDLSGANLRGANLADADLNHANLQGADLTGANLQRANLQGADLSRASLQGANFNGVTLNRACVEAADLTRATLVGANLAAANFRSADLRQANLMNAKLRESDFKSTDFKDAKLTGAIMPNGEVHL